MMWNKKLNEWYDRQGEARFLIMIGLILFCYGIGWLIKPNDASFGIALFVFFGAITRMSYIITMDHKSIRKMKAQEKLEKEKESKPKKKGFSKKLARSFWGN